MIARSGARFSVVSRFNTARSCSLCGQQFFCFSIPSLILPLLLSFQNRFSHSERASRGVCPSLGRPFLSLACLKLVRFAFTVTLLSLSLIANPPLLLHFFIFISQLSINLNTALPSNLWFYPLTFLESTYIYYQTCLSLKLVFLNFLARFDNVNFKGNYIVEHFFR